MPKSQDYGPKKTLSHISAHYKRNEEKTEKCEFPYFGSSEKEVQVDGPKCANSPISVQMLQVDGPKCANSPTSVQMKITSRRTEMCEFPYFGPNEKDKLKGRN